MSSLPRKWFTLCLDFLIARSVILEGCGERDSSAGVPQLLVHYPQSTCNKFECNVLFLSPCFASHQSGSSTEPLYGCEKFLVAGSVSKRKLSMYVVGVCSVVWDPDVMVLCVCVCVFRGVETILVDTVELLRSAQSYLRFSLWLSSLVGLFYDFRLM